MIIASTFGLDIAEILIVSGRRRFHRPKVLWQSKIIPLEFQSQTSAKARGSILNLLL